MPPDHARPKWPWLLAVAALVIAVVWLAVAGDEESAQGDDSAPSQLNTADPALSPEPGPAAASSAAIATAAAGATNDDSQGADAGLAALPDAGDAAAATARARARTTLEQNAREADALVDTFCDESAKVAAALPGADTQRQRDAWPYMSVRIDWEGGVRPPGLLHLSSPLRQRLREYGSDWPARIRDYDLDGLDFAWMAELQQFDHWNVMRDVLSGDPRQSNAFTVAIPNFIDLVSWTKLRFARAMTLGDFAAASADVRQLAFLLRTTGLLVADMQALRMFQVEREAYAHAVAIGKNVGGWQPLPPDALDRYRRVVRSSPQFFAPGVSEATMKRALECNAAARCSAIFEGVGLHLSAAPYAPRDTTAQLDSLANRSGCDPRVLDWLRQTQPLSPAELIETFDAFPNPLQMLRPDAGT